MTNEEIAVRLAEHKKEIGSLKHRVDNCEEQYELLHKMATSIDTMAVNMSYMAKEQKKQGEQIEKLEQAPVEEFKHYKRTIIGCVITAIVGTVVGALISLIIVGG